MADFADERGAEFGQFIIAQKKDGLFQLADLNDKDTREKAKAMQSANNIESLFASARR